MGLFKKKMSFDLMEQRREADLREQYRQKGYHKFRNLEDILKVKQREMRNAIYSVFHKDKVAFFSPEIAYLNAKMGYRSEVSDLERALDLIKTASIAGKTEITLKHTDGFDSRVIACLVQDGYKVVNQGIEQLDEENSYDIKGNNNLQGTSKREYWIISWDDMTINH